MARSSVVSMSADEREELRRHCVADWAPGWGQTLTGGQQPQVNTNMSTDNSQQWTVDSLYLKLSLASLFVKVLSDLNLVFINCHV